MACGNNGNPGLVDRNWEKTIVVSTNVDKVLGNQVNSSTIPNIMISNSTGTRESVLASEEKIGTTLHIRATKAMSRAKFLTSLGKKGLGTNRVEFKQLKQKGGNVC